MSYTSQQAKAVLDENLAKGYKYNPRDIELATSNPDAFMELVGYKNKYTSDAAKGDKALADNDHYWADYTRRQNGYTTNADGTIATAIEGPSSFHNSSFTSSYDDMQQAALNKYLNRGSYQSQYAGNINNLAGQIQNQKDYNYDPMKDPAYQAAYRQMIRESNRATADTMGQYAGMTGGMPSTAAVSAAQQAGNNYRAAFNDNMINFMNADYQKYQDQRADQYNQLSMLLQMDDKDYQKWVDEVGLDMDTVELLNSLRSQQYNEWEANRNFDYGKYTDQLSYDADKQATETQNAQNSYEFFMQMYEQTGDSSWLKKAQELEPYFTMKK